MLKTIAELVRLFFENRRVRRAERRPPGVFMQPEWWADTIRQTSNLREDDDAWEESFHREQ